MTITLNLVVMLRAEHRQTASGLSETGVAWTSSPRTTEAGKGPAAPGAAEYEEDRWPLTAASLLVKAVAE